MPGGPRRPPGPFPGSRAPAPAPAPAPDGALGPLLAARGYILTDTAGGCKAWVKTMDNGEQVVVTSTDGGSDPTRDDWLIGRYVEGPWDPDNGFYRSTQDGPDGSFEDELANVENTIVADVNG